MATANFDIAAADGWVAVTAAAVDFIRIRSNTPNHAIFISTGSTAPASTVVGYKIIGDDDFWCNVPVADNFYVRTAENLPHKTRVDVFSVPS